jgi:hypothetical protein
MALGEQSARRIPAMAFALGLICAGPAYCEWTFGAFFGACSTRDSSLDLRLPADHTDVMLSPIHYRSDSFDSPPYYGYRAALFPQAGWFGIEGEFIHTKIYADTSREVDATGTIQGNPVTGMRPLDSVIDRFSISHGANLLLINAVIRHADRRPPAGQAPRWIVLGRFGVGGSIPHAESTIGSRSQEQYEWGSFSLQGAGALELRMTKRVYLSGEYKLTRTVQHVAVVGGTASTLLLTHHVAVGVTVRAGRFGN